MVFNKNTEWWVVIRCSMWKPEASPPPCWRNTRHSNKDDMQRVQFVVREGRKEAGIGRKEGRIEESLLQAEDFPFHCDCLSLHPPTSHQHGMTRWPACSRRSQVTSGEFVLSILALKRLDLLGKPVTRVGGHIGSRPAKIKARHDRCGRWWRWRCSWSIYRCFRTSSRCKPNTIRSACLISVQFTVFWTLPDPHEGAEIGVRLSSRIKRTSELWTLKEQFNILLAGELENKWWPTWNRWLDHQLCVEGGGDCNPDWRISSTSCLNLQ